MLIMPLKNFRLNYKHLKGIPNIDAMCYILLNKAIIAFPCLLGYLPPTATEMLREQGLWLRMGILTSKTLTTVSTKSAGKLPGTG